MPYTTIHGGDMNERIAHLYQVAIQDTMDYHDENPKLKQKELDNFCATRFSEFIVKECLDQCYNNGMNDELYAGQLKAAAYIEKHFGVE